MNRSCHNSLCLCVVLSHRGCLYHAWLHKNKYINNACTFPCASALCLATAATCIMHDFIRTTLRTSTLTVCVPLFVLPLNCTQPLQLPASTRTYINTTGVVHLPCYSFVLRHAGSIITPHMEWRGDAMTHGQARNSNKHTKKEMKGTATQAVKNHSPHYFRERSHFGTGYRNIPSPKKWENKLRRIRRLGPKPAPDESW